MSSFHYSPRSVARGPRCRCNDAHNPMCLAHRGEVGIGVVITTLSRSAGVRPVTANISATAAGKGVNNGN